jgi:hypothetical protein
VKRLGWQSGSRQPRSPPARRCVANPCPQPVHCAVAMSRCQAKWLVVLDIRGMDDSKFVNERSGGEGIAACDERDLSPPALLKLAADSPVGATLVHLHSGR